MACQGSFCRTRWPPRGSSRCRPYSGYSLAPRRAIQLVVKLRHEAGPPSLFLEPLADALHQSQKREWNPKWENAFAPALCNRIDRNTGGIVIAAKNAETLRIINEKIRAHELEKSYLCITVGRPKQPEGKIEGFLLKKEAKKEVRFFHKPVPGGKTAVTLYRTLESRGGLSLVECRLLTGRTHQIRVSMAEIGCPLLGDGKYGKGDVNRRYHETRQALYSYKLRFDFPTDAGLLNYLKGQEFTVENVPFREKYFPEIPS